MSAHTSHKKRWLITAGMLLLVFVFIIFVDINEVFQLLQGTIWRMWLSGAALLLVGYMVNTARWRYLLSSKPGWLSLFYGDSIAYMSNMITPIPTAVSRIFTSSWATSTSTKETTSAMVVDRLLETMMRLVALMFLLTLLATRQAGTTSTVLTYVGIIVVGVGALVWVSKHQETVVDHLARLLAHLPWFNEAQVQNTIGGLLQNLSYAGSIRHLIAGLIISIVLWLFFLAFQYLTLVAIEPPPAAIAHQILISALGVLILIPPSTTAMVGLYHSVVIGALVGFRLLDSSTATAYAILLHLPQMVFWLLTGAWALTQTNIEFSRLRQAAEAHTRHTKKSASADAQIV